MKPFFSTTLLSVLITGMAAQATNAAASEVQVLLQGKNLEALQTLIESSGGYVTHRLPIISGVGGVVDLAVVDRLASEPGVDKLTDDHNPLERKPERDCPFAGAMDIEKHDWGFVWQLYNFSADTQTLTSIEIESVHPLASLHIELVNNDNSPAFEPTKVPKNGVVDIATGLNPGVSFLNVRFDALTNQWQQSDFKLVAKGVNCESTLAPAYADNSSDVYFPTAVGADLLHEAGITGKGVTVAIIDSGLWDIPPLIKDPQGRYRIAAHFNARTNSTDQSLVDDGGHGSHMASIIANSTPVTGGGGRGFKGIAPGATLIPITTFSPIGDADFMDIIRGIQWVVDNKERFNIGVLNMSLSATPRFVYWDEPLNQAVLKAWQAGITVVAAMGNDGPDWGSVGSPANNPYVISVGAITDSWTPDTREDDYIPDFSARGPTLAGHIKPDIVAPGGHITGLVPPNSALAIENPNYILRSGEFVSTGSSQAAAVVTGMVALLLEARPELSNNDIKCLLKTSAEPAINKNGKWAYSPFAQGAGYANVSRALTLGSTNCDQKQLNIDAAVSGDEMLTGPAERLLSGEPTLPGLRAMLDDTATEKGHSPNRRWGVTEHLKRLDPDTELPQETGVPFDWAKVYAAEQAQIRALSKPNPPPTHP